jgi:hypothetical protein
MSGYVFYISENIDEFKRKNKLKHADALKQLWGKWQMMTPKDM